MISNLFFSSITIKCSSMNWFLLIEVTFECYHCSFLIFQHTDIQLDHNSFLAGSILRKDHNTVIFLDDHPIIEITFLKYSNLNFLINSFSKAQPIKNPILKFSSKQAHFFIKSLTDSMFLIERDNSLKCLIFIKSCFV